MAGGPTCQHCGAPLAGAALFCARCGRPAFLLAGRRARASRNASVFGMSGALLLILQSAFMLAAGLAALYALSVYVGGDDAAARATGTTAAVFVGITLLFDLVGLSLLSLAFHVFTRNARAGATLAERVSPERRSLGVQGLLATVFLVLWVLVTLTWRGALAALVSFYPTPLGTDLTGVITADVRRAASIMLGLWVVASFLLFLGALFGSRFLRRARGAPLTFGRLLWPAETLLHVGAALAIFAVAPGLLASLPRIDVAMLRVVETLGVVDLVVVPVLGLLAYLYLFREFLAWFRGSALPGVPPASSPAAPSGPPGEET
ncbi:MAG TPA: zinc ribbon domain-containing protein [Thermoplasmata archaeon]|nr:zinc ribbon domain-containing protein [Thermoplasmata archaeon]